MTSTYVHQTAGLHLRRDSSKTVLGNCSDWVTDAVPLRALHFAWVKGPAHAFYALSPAIMCRSDMRQYKLGPPTTWLLPPCQRRGERSVGAAELVASAECSWHSSSAVASY
ncbi:hypothetical protein ISCGN_009158 [Ixodes scapularis]